MHSFARDLGWLVVFVERVLASPVQVEDSRPAESEDRLTRHVTCRVAFRLVGDFGGDFSSLVQLIFGPTLPAKDGLRLRRITMPGINSFVSGVRIVSVVQVT